MKLFAREIFTMSIMIFFIASSQQCFAESGKFNMEIQIPETYTSVSAGTEVWFTVHVLNLDNNQTNMRQDIVLISEVIDDSGNVHATKTKTVAIETQASFVSSIIVPETLDAGKYRIRTRIDSSDALAVHDFKIVLENNQSHYWILGVAIIIILLSLIIVINNKKIVEWRLRSKVKEIIKKRLKK
ncbi:MAG: hypothetical protein ACP5NV_03900 [Candidatus Woesearchaeota archaeon]